MQKDKKTISVTATEKIMHIKTLLLPVRFGRNSLTIDNETIRHVAKLFETNGDVNDQAVT